MCQLPTLTQIVVLYFAIIFSVAAKLPCRANELLSYTVVFNANWTKERFPRQYPEFRPPAQWTKVVGVSHNEDYRIFQLGEQASKEVKLFAETGKQEILGNEQSGQVLDEFLLPSIKNGTGKVQGDFFVDANHSKVSLLVRIVPSPDWFVGIDSLDLCADGHWVDSVIFEASPIDAGTDSGFTFTSPNWATEPQEGIYEITSQYPRHPANSFYYPQLQDLPPIAVFQIHKKKSYDAHDSEAYSNVNITKSLPTQDMMENEVWKFIKKRTRKKKRSKKHGVKINCEVGEWSSWSVCNGLCGQSRRSRNITLPGKNCPPLLEERTCGCTKYVFNW